MNKQERTFKKLWIVCAAICMCLAPFHVTKIHASAEYEIIFKAGSHGKLNGNKEVKHRLTTEDVFPDEPVITVEDGYVFQGWSKELPAVGSNVNQKAVYVAKYGVVINGLSYTVRYVDENKTDIATAKTMLGEKGTKITERAKAVPGYTYQQTSQSFVLDQNNKEILFVYTLTNPNEVIRYENVKEYEYSNQTETNNQTNNANGQNNNQSNPGNTQDEEEINDNRQPNSNGEEENIDDKKTPEAKGGQDYTVVVGIGAGVLVIGGMILIFLKKKKQTAAE